MRCPVILAVDMVFGVVFFRFEPAVTRLRLSYVDSMHRVVTCPLRAGFRSERGCRLQQLKAGALKAGAVDCGRPSLISWP